MPKISVIIPVYNHGDELTACLASLNKQTEQDVEIIIVDDGSVPPILIPSNVEGPSLITFTKNQGAPAARNAGFAKSTGEYVIFLDADIDLKPDALQKMLQALTEHPEADFAYPSHRFGFKTMPARPFEIEALKKTNYIHTSALMRRKAFPGFDEQLKRFQDWDLFLTMAEAGKKGIWVDEVLFTVKTHGTMSQWLPSFAYDLPWQTIGWMPKAIKKYKDADAIIRAKHGLPVGARYIVPLPMGTLNVFAIILLVEALSIPAAWIPELNSVFAVIAGVAMLICARKTPITAFGYLLLEFLIGSKGRLLVFGANTANDGGISLRIILFSTFLLGWFVARIRKAKREIPTPLFALITMVVYAYWRGIALNQPYIFVDVNAWAVLLLIIPIFDLAKLDQEKFWSTIKNVAMVGIGWTIIKSIKLFYLFSHNFNASILEFVHRWVRRTGVGEITILGDGGIARVFIQSQIYPLLASVWLAGEAIRHRVSKEHWSATALCLLAVLISFSRSFWLALGSGLFICFIFVLRRKVWRWTKGILGAGALAIFALIGIAWFPLPSSTAGNPIAWFTARIDAGESAATSRWELLPILFDKAMEAPILGHGFGATATYQSADPRVVAQTGGLYTTYAFEWGWLDLWIKFGILGPLIMLWILAAIIKKRPHLAPVIATLAIVHMFTPYLNHPLGIMILMLALV